MNRQSEGSLRRIDTGPPVPVGRRGWVYFDFVFVVYLMGLRIGVWTSEGHSLRKVRLAISPITARWFQVGCSTSSQGNGRVISKRVGARQFRYHFSDPYFKRDVACLDVLRTTVYDVLGVSTLCFLIFVHVGVKFKVVDVNVYAR